MQVTKDIRYIGVNDHEIDLFEGQYTVPNGMSYNSYVILDEKTAVMDTVDAKFTHEWLDNLAEVLGGRTPTILWFSTWNRPFRKHQKLSQNLPRNNGRRKHENLCDDRQFLR